MDRRQRLDDHTTNMEALKRATKASMWTAMPGIVQSFNAAAMTAQVQLAIKGVYADPKTSALSFVNLPLLVDVPVCFPGWGGVTLTFPIVKGDECLVVFASRCIDAWWQNGGVQKPLEYRMHDLSDGFMTPGGRSQPRVLTGLSTTTAQFRSDDGSAYVEIDPASHKINMVAPGGVKITGPVAVTGAVSVTGAMTATGEGTFNSHTVGNHTHGGVTAGSATTAIPTG